MSIFSILNSNNTALNADTQAISITSNNISNVNNPNYARQIADFQQRSPAFTPQGAIPQGLDVTAITTRNSLLDAQVQLQASITAGVTAQATILQQIQSSLGENLTANTGTSGQSSTTSNGLNVAVNQFFNAFQNLATNPTNTGASQQVVAEAGILADRFKAVTANLNTIAQGVTSQINSNVSQVNQYLAQIASLNVTITQLNGQVAGSASALVDQRQAIIEQLSALMPVTVSGSNQGSLTITAHQNDTPGTPVTLVTLGTVNNQISFVPSTTNPNAGNFVAGTGGSTVSLGNLQTTSGDPSGTLSGLLMTLSGPLNDLQKNIDNLAQQIVTSVNQAYNPSGSVTGNVFAVPDPSVTNTLVGANNPLNTLIPGNPALATSNTFTISIGSGSPIVIYTNSTDSLQSVLQLISSNTGGAVTGSYNAATDKIVLTGASAFTLNDSASNFLAKAKIATGTYGASAVSSDTIGALTSVKNVPGAYSSAFTIDPNFTPTNIKAGNTLANGAGDNSYAIAVTNVVNHKFSTAQGAPDKIDGTLAQYYAGVVSGLGQSLQSANTNLADEKNIQTVILGQRQSVSGVNLDEEMSHLMAYQKSFQACAEVMQVIESLLSNFISSLH
jgi:flagellar hook-associated protein 1 FlgK